MRVSVPSPTAIPGYIVIASRIDIPAQAGIHVVAAGGFPPARE